MITIEDVEFICETIDKELTQDEKTKVLSQYKEMEEYENWSIMVEDLIYQIISER